MALGIQINSIFLAFLFLFILCLQFVSGVGCYFGQFSNYWGSCQDCGFKCAVCTYVTQCSKCHTGYSLFQTSDGRVICKKDCPTIYVTNTSNTIVLQGFFLFNNTCSPCIEGCLNCIDGKTCLECDSTGLSATPLATCRQLIKLSCPSGTGYESRLHICVDCSWATANYLQYAKIECLTCLTTDVYSCGLCKSGYVLKNRDCIISPTGSYTVDFTTAQAFISIMPDGCRSPNTSDPTICFACHSNYYPYNINSKKQCARTNSALGSCVAIANTQGVSANQFIDDSCNLTKCSLNENSIIGCPVKPLITSKYENHINQSLTNCPDVSGVLYQQAVNQKICIGQCPHLIIGVIAITYYTQWSVVDYTSSPPVTGICKTTCDTGYAVDEQNRHCYECSSIPNCKRCSLNNFSFCIECIDKTLYSLTSSGQCVLICTEPFTQLDSNGNTYCLSCNISFCYSCSSPSTCSMCLGNRDTTTNCASCKSGYGKDPLSVGTPSFNDCIYCDTLHQLFTIDSSGYCREECGKGYHVSQQIQCDDGNNVDGDGCSATCGIESGWVCTGGSQDTRDKCEKINSSQLSALSDPNFNFTISFDQTNGSPSILANFSQTPQMANGFTLTSAVQVNITGLLEDDFSFSVSQVNSTRRMAIFNEVYIDTDVNYRQLSASTMFSFAIQLFLPSTIKDRLITVTVQLGSILNSSGMMLGSSSASLTIKEDCYTEDEKNQASQVQSVATAAKATLLVSGTSVLMLSGFYKLANIIDITELIYYFLYLDISYPLNVKTFFGQFSTFQFKHIPNPFQIILDNSDQSCHSHLTDLDTDSLFIRNSGQNVLLLSIIALSIFFVDVVSKLCPSKNRFKSKLLNLAHELKFKVAVDSFFVAYLNLVASAFLQFQDMSVGQSSSETSDSSSVLAESFNLVIFACIFIGCLAAPVAILFFLYDNKDIIETPPELMQLNIKSPEEEQDLLASITPVTNFSKKLQQHKPSISLHHLVKLRQIISKNLKSHKYTRGPFILKYGQLFMGCKTTQFHLFAFNCVVYFRKIVLSMIIMMLMGKSELQIFLLVVHHIIFAVYIARYMPYKIRSQNILNFITEILFVLMELFLMRLASKSTTNDSKDRQDVGNWIIGIFTIIMFSHIFILFRETYEQLKIKYQDWLVEKQLQKTAAIATTATTINELQNCNKSETSSQSGSEKHNAIDIPLFVTASPLQQAIIDEPQKQILKSSKIVPFSNTPLSESIDIQRGSSSQMIMEAYSTPKEVKKDSSLFIRNSPLIISSKKSRSSLIPHEEGDDFEYMNDQQKEPQSQPRQPFTLKLTDIRKRKSNLSNYIQPQPTNQNHTSNYSRFSLLKPEFTQSDINSREDPSE